MLDQSDIGRIEERLFGTRRLAERKDRAKAFLEALPRVTEAVTKKLQELRGMANRRTEEESTLQVLGWVASELQREQASIEDEFGGESL